MSSRVGLFNPDEIPKGEEKNFSQDQFDDFVQIEEQDLKSFLSPNNSVDSRRDTMCRNNQVSLLNGMHDTYDNFVEVVVLQALIIE